MWHTGLWIKTRHALRKGFFHPSPTVESCSHSALSLTAIVRNTIKSREGEKKGEKKTLSTYHELRHRIHINTRSTCTTHTGRMDVTIDFWPDVRDAAQIQKLWLQKVFLSFKSCNCSTRPGQRLALYLDSGSIEPWNSLKRWHASISNLRKGPCEMVCKNESTNALKWNDFHRRIFYTLSNLVGCPNPV